MPKYIYRCDKCEEVSEKAHSMSERLTDCEACNTAGSLKKIPAAIAIQYKDNKSGKFIEDYIKEAKEEVSVEKEKMAKEEYK